MRHWRYPHKRTIGMSRDLYTALCQVARWREITMAEAVRAACKDVFNREYQLRGLEYPSTPEPALPGQIELPLGGDE